MQQLPDPKNIAQTLLDVLEKQPYKINLPVATSTIKLLCKAVLEQKQETPLPPLTDAESSVFAAIKSDIDQGIPPTVRSVQARLRYGSPNSARVIIDRLIKYGYLKREGKQKQITVVIHYK